MSKADELKDQGIALFQQRDYEAAARLFQQAQAQYEADGQMDMVAEMKTNIGLVHRTLGENQKALDLMQEAMEAFRDLEDPLRMAKILGNLGGVYVAMGDKEQAHNCFRQAADIFDELGEKELYGQTMLAIGDLQVRDGKLTSGAATYQVGLENIEDLSASQKMIKFLSGVVNKISGSGG